MPATRRRLRSHDEHVEAGFAAVRTEHGLSVEPGPAALEEARSAVDVHAGGRRDLTDVAFVTLDPPGSKDLDQAMHLCRRGDGYRVRYAIADVGAFVVPGGGLDRSTHERVETVYCPDLRVPLHPPVLSEDRASLLPDVDRPAVVWTFDLDCDGVSTTVGVERAVVRSRARLDYPTEQRRLDAGTADRDDPMRLLTEIGVLRARLERARGGVSLGRAEQEVDRGADGRWELTYRSGLAVEDHNAQISLLTGMAAAELMISAGVGVLRTLPAARPEDLQRLRRRARALGVAWPEDATYADVLAGVDHERPQTAAFLAAATTLFRGAAWTPFTSSPPADHQHGAMAAPYAHVTAPLRRLVDRYGLEICLAAHTGSAVPAWVLEELPGLGETMAVGSRRSAAVDRACTDLVEAVVLADRVGERFEAVAVDDRTVQLREPAVVARTRTSDLPPGRSVVVELVEADVAERRVTFALVDDAPGVPSPPGAGARP